MFKRTALLLSLSLPLLALAADEPRKGERGDKKGDRPAAAAPAASGAKVNKRDSATEIKRNQSRGAAMGDCTKQAADQKLSGVERKQFIATCVKPK